MKPSYFIIIIMAASIFNGCRKAEKYRQRLAGPKTISHYQWKKQAPDGSFSITIHDTTDLADIILWDNSDEVLNNATYVGNVYPAGWKYANVGIQGITRLPLGWYSDYETDETLTFWSENKDPTKFRVTYAMKRLGRNKIRLETTYHTIDGVFFEMMELVDSKK